MTLTVTDSKIIKQVEFYFSDSNLPRDKFLLECIQKNEEKWVDLDTISTFTRMKQLGSLEEIISALKKSTSTIFEVSEDHKKVRRVGEMPESRDLISRSVYVKGFPLDSTLDSLEKFFDEKSVKIGAIRMRRNPKTKEFKGSVFLEFVSEDSAKSFVDAFKDISFSEGSPALIVKSKMQYFEDKNAEKSSGRSGSIQKNLLAEMGPGRLVKINEFPAVEGLPHAILKDALKESFPVAFVDFNYEAGSAWVRFKEAVAEEFTKTYTEESPLLIGESKVFSFTLPSEEEQGSFYEASLPKHNSARRSAQSNKKRSFEKEIEKVKEDQPKKSKAEESVAEEDKIEETPAVPAVEA